MPRFMEGIYIQSNELIIQRGAHALVTPTFVDACGICVLDSDVQRLFSDKALTIIEECGSLRIFVEAQERFRAFHAEVEAEQHTISKVCQFLSVLIEESTEQFNNRRVEGWSMGFDLVELAHSQTPESLLTLPDLSKLLLSNKNKITKMSKEIST